MNTRCAIPFSVDRSDRRDLVAQVADGFRDAIRAGRYAAGERLPTQASMARELGVSLRVANKAIARLSAERLVVPRPRTGCTVAEDKNRFWSGRVLLILSEVAGSYYYSTLSTTLGKRMVAEGYLFSTIFVESAPDGTVNLLPIDAMLTYTVDFAVLMNPYIQVVQRLQEFNVPYMLLGFEAPGFPGCRGWIPYSRITAIPDFVMHCRRRNIHTALQVGLGQQGAPDAAPALRREGIEVENWVLPDAAECVWLEDISAAGLRAFTRRFGATPRSALPDVIFFTDDYVARGGLTALLSLGIRVPQDVGVVTLANKRFAPTFPVSLTRMEFDPFLHGETIADCILAGLKGQKPSIDHILGPSYIIGKSF